MERQSLWASRIEGCTFLFLEPEVYRQVPLRENDRYRIKEVEKLTEEISNAYSKVKLIRLHYDLLNEKISKMGQNDGGNSPN
jgi:hypothetical protein